MQYALMELKHLHQPSYKFVSVVSEKLFSLIDLRPSVRSITFLRRPRGRRSSEQNELD